PDFTCPSLPSLLLFFFFTSYGAPRYLHSFPTRRSSDLTPDAWPFVLVGSQIAVLGVVVALCSPALRAARWPLLAGGGVLMLAGRSEEHTSELQSRGHLVCRLLLEKKKICGNGGFKKIN